MNRLPILAKMLLLLVCFSVMLSAYNAGSDLNNYLIIPKVEFSPTIDGTLDADWTFPEVGMFVYVTNDFPEGGAADMSCHYRVAWNDNGLYFFGRVFDDSIDVSHANSWERDCFEIYIDGDNSKAASYDGVDDIQWRFVYASETADGGQAPNAEIAWMETEIGWDFELAIPASDLADTNIVLTEGAVIGWEVQVADNDGGDRENIEKWWSNSNDSYLNPSLFGTAILGGADLVLEIPEVEFAPTIDGVIDADWALVVPEVAMTVNTGEALPNRGFNDFSTYYSVAWNANGLYFFGRVLDDSIDVSHANSWERDCWEIYIDGDNSKGASYDGVDDIQWRFVYASETADGGQAPNAEIAWMETEIGWDFELAIPASDLADTNITLAEGNVIGWETQVADNDGGDRAYMSKWWSNSNDSYLNPSLFGTAKLVSAVTSAVFPALPAGLAEADLNIELSVPSVLSAVGSVSYTTTARGSVSLKLYNLAGQAVKELDGGVKAAGTHTVSVDASGLANGVYICKLEAGNSAAAKKMMVIK